MSRDVHRTPVRGTLGAAPDVHYSQHGQARATFRVAVNERWTGSDGQQHTHTEWYRVVCWGPLGEFCGAHLQKGSRVLLEGRMRTQRWQDGQGQERMTVELHADDVIFLDSRRPENHTSKMDESLEP